MAYFLFIDESGHDRKASPYEVLAGICIKDSDLWRIINALHEAEIKNFGRRYSAGVKELKGMHILNTGTFRQSTFTTPQEISPVEIPTLAKAILDNGANGDIRQIKALALAKLAYAKEVFNICKRFNCHAFASIIETDAEKSSTNGLRKDYSYLFERFYYFLQDQNLKGQGIVVFDELEKAKSHLLIDQTHRYFKEYATGRKRADLIIPEPFFVHSDLTTGVQIADLIAYTISWGFRTPQMTKPARSELKDYARQIASLRYCATREKKGKSDFEIWSFAHITDFRTRSEKQDMESIV